MKKLIISLFTVIFVLMLSLLTISAAASDDYLVIDADDLYRSVTGSHFDSAFTSIGEKYFVKFTAKDDAAHSEGAQFQFDFTSNALTEGFRVKDYPFVKVSYISDFSDPATMVDFNYGLDYLGESSRIWGLCFSYTKGEKHDTYIFNTANAFDGGEKNISADNPYSYDKIDDDSVCNYMRFKPIYGGKVKKGEYFAVEYIGFFKTEAEAKAYEHESVRTLKSLDAKYSVCKLTPGKTLDISAVPYPSFINNVKITYSSADENIATVDSAGIVTAVSSGKTTIIAKAEGTDIMCETKIIVEENIPLDWYAKDYYGGKKITVNVLGDSISADISKNAHSSKYHGVWASKFNMDINNWSRGGSAVTGNYTAEGNLLETYVPRMERMVEGKVTSQEAVTNENKPDILVVWGGTNDYNGEWAIGNPGDPDRNTFCGAIGEIIKMAWENYPDAKIVFFTPIKRCDYAPEEGWDNCGKRRFELDEYVNAMLETCKYYGVPCLDFYNNERLEFIGLRTRYITDGVHLSVSGHKIFADVAVEEMEKAGIIKTHGYLETVSRLFPLNKGRSLSDDSHVFDAAEINALTRYGTRTLLDVQRLARHTLTDTAVRFTPETLTSKIAPTVTINLNNLGFSAIDYPYVAVTYKTSSTADNITVAFRANNNRVSIPDTMPELKSGESATLLLNIKDFSNDEIILTEDKYYNDMYLTMAFFESTYDMNADSYIDIESIAFFKYPLDAMLYRHSLTGEDIDRGSGFSDTLSHWGCDSIDFAVKEGLFNGVTKTKFEPESTMTRGMLAVVLARLAGDTENKTEYPFTDVAQNAWFASGVSFAYANGIVDAGESFRPDDNITREELADMLYRYAKSTGKKIELADLDFADVDKISSDKRDAIAYCVSAGIIKGYDNNTVNPTGSAKRAEVATMIYRFVQA